MLQYSLGVRCRLDRPVLADTGWVPRQLFGFDTDSARRPRWGSVSRTKGCLVCLAAWRSTTVAEHPSVIQGLLALDLAGPPPGCTGARRGGRGVS